MDLLPSDAPSPRLCHLIKWPDFDGYGFNLHAEKAKMGQFIGKVDVDSPAQMAGLREGDRIIEVNAVNISTENHRQVVERIKSLERETKLLVVDPETDDWYKENDLVVKSTQLNVIYIKTPVPRPSSDSPRAQQHQPLAPAVMSAPVAAAAASVPTPSVVPVVPVVEEPQQQQEVTTSHQQQQQQQPSHTIQIAADSDEPAGDEAPTSDNNETRAIVHADQTQIVHHHDQQQQADEQDHHHQQQPQQHQQQQQQSIGRVTDQPVTEIKLNVTMDNDDADNIEQQGGELIQSIGILKSDKKMRNGSAESSISTTPDCSESNMSQSPVVRPDSTASTQSHDSILTGDDDSMPSSLGHNDLDTMKTMDNGTLKGSTISSKTSTNIINNNNNNNNNNSSSVNFMECLNLNMTASEMRELISRRKKFDPKKAQMNIRQKYEIIQQM